MCVCVCCIVCVCVVCVCVCVCVCVLCVVCVCMSVLSVCVCVYVCIVCVCVCDKHYRHNAEKMKNRYLKSKRIRTFAVGDKVSVRVHELIEPPLISTVCLAWLYKNLVRDISYIDFVLFMGS